MIAETIMVPVSEVIENPWNPNEQTDTVFNELVHDIDKEGFDEPLQVVKLPEDDPEYQKGKRYRVIGGAHRLRAIKHLGLDQVPVVVKSYPTEEEQKIKTVRRNLLRGDLNRLKFTRLVNELDRRVDNEFAVALGLSSKEQLSAMLINNQGKYTEELAERIAEVQKEETAIRNISMILNKLFSEFGDTLKHSYMFFTYGTKLHLMVMMSRQLQKLMDAITTHCSEKDKSVNDVLEHIVQFGFDFLREKSGFPSIVADQELPPDAQTDTSTTGQKPGPEAQV